MVSIILATYNREHLIKESLLSIIAQSYEDWECIVVDDGSTDNTAALLNEFTNTDKRFRYLLRTENYKKGLPGSRNCGLDSARGDYVIFFDDDDIVHPLNLELCLSEIQAGNYDYCTYKKQSFELVSTVQEFDLSTDFSTSDLGVENAERVVNGQNPMASCTVLWKKQCFEGHRFNETLMYAEEWECYSRILSDGKKGVSMDKILYFNRKHPDSNTAEFWNNDPIRVESKKRAAKLIIDNFRKKDILTNNLVRFFVQMGIQLKDIGIVKYVLNRSEISLFRRGKYMLLFYGYPFIRSYLKAKKYLGDK
ncbi:glycosyltransferase [Leptobacterium flavescens]|uniref:Glycosyltransferase n=1 Tax=Leptobacterium flavescens TaxID=472055 RepID=A0A6P0UHT2_9FLAO|nr:glycosyltransferase family 2 protein [Leptobacterium flavescens]NER12182.1 glycosyltransferase [Leptobacterium flavescens]